MILSRAATILYTSIALLASGVKAQTDKAKGDKSPTKGKTSKKPTKVCDDENGYEAFRNAPPADAKVKFEGVVDCETQTYTLKYSFEPDKSLPFINNITKVDWNGTLAHPEKAATCLEEGMGPGLTENVPAGTHVGLNEHYTEYVFGYETTKRIQEATGYKLLTIGAAPCGTPITPYPHYSMHFYTVSVNDRKKIKCRSNGGFFCLPATEQCSESASKYNMDGVGLERCDDDITYANVPSGFAWTIDGNPAIGINAANPSVGLHGLVPADLAGGNEPPLLLLVQYDATIIANHIVMWGGLPLGENNPGNDYSWSKNNTYNCQNIAKYPSLPIKTSVDYVAAEGRTYMTITGPTTQCKESFTEKWDSTDPSSKSGKDAKKAVFN